jgi:cytochrome c oxidase subunit 1
MYAPDWGHIGALKTGHFIGIIGLATTLLCMVLRSMIDDHGFHIEEDEILKDLGGKA